MYCLHSLGQFNADRGFHCGITVIRALPAICIGIGWDAKATIKEQRRKSLLSKTSTVSYPISSYYRLSCDEDEELNSLSNQRKVIYNYAISNGQEVVGESFDDNVSGMYFNRSIVPESIKSMK